jgi:putative ABC transport system permease protein
MLGNYFATAWRNLLRHKLHSFINIAGLTVGLACTIFIILFVCDQLSYDRWIPGTENLYRVETALNLPGKPAAQNAKAPFAMAQAMQDQIPEVTARTRLIRGGATILAANRQFAETLSIVDTNFLQVIALPLAAGDPAAALRRPDSVVLSQSTARKYFGDEPALGKRILLSRQQCDDAYQNCQVRQTALQVTAILRDLPHNTQLRAEIVIPNNSAAIRINPEMQDNWLFISGWSYVRLAPGAEPAAEAAKTRTIIDRALDPARRLNVRARGSEVLTPRLTPFVDVHLDTDRFGGMTAPGNRSLVYGFAAIGALILLIACFNFTNLATARAMLRVREIGLRKVVGARRRQLVAQFLGEALFTAAIALMLALALTEILLPAMDRLLGQPVEFHYVRDWGLSCFIVAVAVLAGLLSGVYPALMLSSFRPASSLRANGKPGRGGGRTRSALVVFQFAVSIGLGIAVAVIYAQIIFSRNLDLGFNRQAVIDVNVNSVSPAAAESLARMLKTGPGIQEVALSQAVPFSDDHNSLTAHTPGANFSQDFALVPSSPGFMAVYDIKLLAGRLLSEDRATDGVDPEQLQGKDVRPFNVLINAMAARRMGYSPQEAVGKTLILDAFGGTAVSVVGVVADIRQDGPAKPVNGTIYMYWRSFPLGHLSVRIRGDRMQEALAFLDRSWRSYSPNIALQWHFLEDDYNRQFLADERQGSLFAIFVGVAIFIACLGLFGLAAFMVSRRTREIGIRKVFGARTRDVVLLLLWQFSVPVALANLIAWPVAWYYLQDWLQGFAYRISLSPLYFLAAGATALLIAWATVFVHAFKVARASPIHALRYE